MNYDRPGIDHPVDIFKALGIAVLFDLSLIFLMGLVFGWWHA